MYQYLSFNGMNTKKAKLVDGILELYKKLAAHDAEHLDPRFQMGPERIHQMTLNAYLAVGKIVVAKDGDKLIGFIATHKGDPELISELYVEEAYRRGGVARALVLGLKSMSPPNTIHRVTTVIGNREAIRFYQSVGFLPLTMGLSESGV